MKKMLKVEISRWSADKSPQESNPMKLDTTADLPGFTFGRDKNL